MTDQDKFTCRSCFWTLSPAT